MKKSELIENFLWDGLDLKKTKAKVKWDMVSIPKKNKGIGLRNSYNRIRQQ